MINKILHQFRDAYPMFTIFVIVTVLTGMLAAALGIPPWLGIPFLGAVLTGLIGVMFHEPRWFTLLAGWLLQRTPVELIAYSGQSHFSMCYTTSEVDNTPCAPVYYAPAIGKVFLNPDGTIAHPEGISTSVYITRWLPLRKQDRVAHVLTYGDFNAPGS